MTGRAELAWARGAQPQDIWCGESAIDGVHLGEAYGFPSCDEHPSDERAHTEGPSNTGAVTALRALFEAGGPLVASGVTARHDLGALRALFRQDTARGARRFAEEGLRWRLHDVSLHSERPARGDVLQRDVRTFVYMPSSAPSSATDAGEAVGVGEALEEDTTFDWQSCDQLRRDWRKGRTLLSPSVAEVVRRGAMACEDPPTARLFGWAVTPHVEMLPVRTPTLPPATHTNCFLVGSNGVVLVEPATPFADELDVIERWVRGAVDRGARLVAVLATHHHPDHIGGATALRDRFGVPLWAHALTADRLQGRIAFDRHLEDGEVLELGEVQLTALHTPGHAPGHLCFHDRTSGAMIAGDMVAGVGTILVEPYDGDMAWYLRSLRRMSDCEPSMLLPAHGGVIRDSEQMLEHYVAHRLMREQKVIDALSTVGGTSHAQALLEHAYDDAPRAVWPLALRSIEAHLIKLEQEGRVTRLDQGDRPWSLV